MSTLVMKFGGTSTGSEEALNCAADIVHTEVGNWDQVVVVVSAMEGITDMLLECAEHARTGNSGQLQFTIEKLHQKLTSIVYKLFPGEEHLLDLISIRITELIHLCQRIQNQGTASTQELAQFAALGERINVHVFAAALLARNLHSEPVDAADLIITDDCFQSASPIKSLTNERITTHLAPLLAEGTIPVVTGFIGSSISGETTTLGRGGSDYSAAILAESLGADEIWIWTDVDGVLTADPNLIPGARLIPEISYDEVFQLAFSGAQVLHPKSILPAKEAGIPLFVRNTFNQKCPGTRIGHRFPRVNHAISAVTGSFDIKTFTFKVKPGEDADLIKTHLLTALNKRGVPTLGVFPSKHDRSISFAIPAKSSNLAIKAIRDSWTKESFDRTFNRAEVDGDLALITIIGRDISLSPQALPKVSRTLEKAGVKIKQVGNGASSDAISLTVQAQNGELAVQQIHDRIILNGNSGSCIQPTQRHQPAI